MISLNHDGLLSLKEEVQETVVSPLSNGEGRKVEGRSSRLFLPPGMPFLAVGSG